MKNEVVDKYRLALTRCFQGENGDDLLQIWDEMYCSRISFQAGIEPEEVAFREGERAFVQRIKDELQLIKEGK